MMERRSGEDRRRDAFPMSNDRRGEQERRELLKDPDITVGRLRTTSMFAGLSAEQYMQLLRICSKKTYARNERIYSPGDEPSEMFILVRGNLRVTFENGLVIEDHGPAGMVGELGVVTGERRTATVTAMTDCLVLAFRREELFGLFRRDTELWTGVLTNIIRDISGRMRQEDAALDELRRSRSLEIL